MVGHLGMRFLLVTVVAIALIAGVPARAQDNSGAVIVDVTDNGGRPIRNACVTLVPKSGDIIFRKADRNGRVRVDGLPRGDYRVVVKVDGYKATKRTVAHENATDVVSFVLEPRND